MSKELLSKIKIDYNGNFASQMDWRMDTLSKFSKVADLRSNITIRHALVENKKEVEVIGDTLALKRLSNPLDMFTFSSSPQKYVATKVNFVKGEASVEIDDSSLTRNAMEKKGKIVEEQHIHTVNELVNKGLRNILTQEKNHQARLAALTDIYGVGAISFISVGLRLLAEGFVTTALGELRNDFGEIFKGGSETISGIIMFSIGCNFLNFYLENAMQENGYFLNTNDKVNPAKHIARAQAGNLYLRIGGKTLVSSK